MENVSTRYYIVSSLLIVQLVLNASSDISSDLTKNAVCKVCISLFLEINFLAQTKDQLSQDQVFKTILDALSAHQL